MRIEELREYGLDELHRLYDESAQQVPDTDDLTGELRGEVLAGRGIARTSAWRTAAKYAPWSGLDVDERGGSNVLGYGPLTFQRYGFESYVERDREGGALVFDYDLPENPFALRRIEEHVRRVDDELYLVKVFANAAGRKLFLYYYAVEPRETEIEVR